MNGRLPILFVEQNHSMVIERLGRFNRVLEPGLRFKIPFLQEVRYQFSLKQQVKNIESQAAITRDNVKLTIDGILYYRITDSEKAAYQVQSPVEALVYLAQTSMRSQIGKIDLDHTFRERSSLNSKIKQALNDASKKWGIECMRYEIKDIHPPTKIMRSMELQAESERTKRSKILNSEGIMQSQINVAEGERKSQILNGQGEAQKVLQEARALCQSLDAVAGSLQDEAGMKALNLKLTEQYLRVLSEILRMVQTVVIPEKGAMVSQLTSLMGVATKLYKGMVKSQGLPIPSQSEIESKVIHDINKHTSNTQDSAKHKQLFDHKVLYSE